MPVAMVAEAFKENGLTQPSDMHATSPAKLREIFGADAALYITVALMWLVPDRRIERVVATHEPRDSR